jgi:hypothetical protein
LSGPPAKPSWFQAATQWLIQLIGIKPNPGNALQTALWAPIMETYGAFELTREWNPRWLERYAREIMDVVPEGAIYFGGTDAGRFAVTQFSTSHIQGKPFFTLTQNALADMTYVDYLTGMYGFSIAMPTPADYQQAFQDYLTEAQRRLRDGKLKKGENVSVAGGRVSVSGQPAVMMINALLVKRIIEKNPQREFYLEQSFPLSRLDSHLEPQGPIFKLHHAPLPNLSEATIAANRQYWNRFLTETLGHAAANAQTAEAACELVERIEMKGDRSGFDGDTSFVKEVAARRAFAMLRCQQARVYAERAKEPGDGADAKTLNHEAERAFREAWLLWPQPEVGLWPLGAPGTLYQDFLVEQGNQAAADRVQQTLDALSAARPLPPPVLIR